MHPDTWTFYGYVLVLQPVRIPSYCAVFFLGAWAWKYRWFTPQGYTPSTLPWGTAFIISSILYLWQKLSLPQLISAPGLIVWVNAFCQGTMTVSSLFALLAIFHRKLNFSTRITSALSATSYGVYYLHQPILFPLVWLFLAFPLPSPIKLLIVSALTLSVCFFLSRYGLNSLPGLRRCFQS